ncbi:MAG: hypothetical protein H0V09_05645, partial [Gemmatimonadetes bacterium]|nr:hypothetical protein [Gemmatimonadota bacterium]
MRLALVTCPQLPEGTPDDAVLLPHLRAAGFQPEFVSWDDETTDWRAFRAVVVRSTWDYHARPRRFLRWIEHCAETGIALWNPPRVLRWNHHKRYLRDLAEHGVPVVETEWLERGRPSDLAELLRHRGWDVAVVKPAVSAGARRTRTVRSTEAGAEQPVLDRMLRSGDVLVQPFLEAVVGEGEWSLIFFGGELSHAILKRPAAGDFRVQERFGGTVEAATAPGWMTEQAAAVLEAVEVLGGAEGDLLYAR